MAVEVNSLQNWEQSVFIVCSYFLGIYLESEGIPLFFRTLESGERAAAAAI